MLVLSTILLWPINIKETKMKKYLLLILIYTILSSCVLPQDPKIASDNSMDNKKELRTTDNDCLENAYTKLDQAKGNLEKLKIVYSEKMEKLQVLKDSIDRQRLAIVCYLPELNGLSNKNRNDINLLNDAYDDKYIKFISALGDNLRTIEKCKLTMGEKNWYDQSGRTYYRSMIDKYKRN